MDYHQKERYGIDDLLRIMELLRSPGGCPWDKVQTHQSIRKNFIEETYEVVEAIDNQDASLLREELGDVLLQVVFHTQMERERGIFDFGDVCDGICKKLILRHPHIFSDTVADTPAEVLKNWEEIKKQEKRQTTHAQVLKSVPRVLPSLMRSEKVQHRAAKSGFDYPDVEWAMGDLRSEVEELAQAIAQKDAASVDEELGDLLFSVVNVARFVQVDPEHSLKKSCDKFISRFAHVEQIAADRGVALEGADMDLLDDLWQEAKTKNEKTLEVRKND